MKVAYSEYWSMCLCCFVVDDGYEVVVVVVDVNIIDLVVLVVFLFLVFLIHTVKRLHLVFCSVFFLHVYSIFHYNIYLSLFYRFGEFQIHLDSMYCAIFIFYFLFFFLIFFSLDNFFCNFFLIRSLFDFFYIQIKIKQFILFFKSKKKRMVKCLMILVGKKNYWQMIEIMKIIKKKKNVFAIKLKNLVRKKQFLVKIESAIWVKETNRFFQEHTFCFVLFCNLSFALCYGIFDDEK